MADTTDPLIDAIEHDQNKPKKPWLARYMYPLIFLVLILGISDWLTDQIQFVMGESLQTTLVWKANRPVQQDDIVQFTLDDDRLASRSFILFKRAWCAPGMRFKIDEHQAACGDEGSAKYRALHRNAKTGEGRPLPVFIFDGHVPDQQWVILGDHPDSFDTRYLGFKDEKTLTAFHEIF